MLELGIQATTTFLSAATAVAVAAATAVASRSAADNGLSYAATSYDNAATSYASNIDDNAFDNWSSDIVSASLNYASNGSSSSSGSSISSDSLSQLSGTHAIIMNDTTIATALAAFVANYCNPSAFSLLYNSTSNSSGVGIGISSDTMPGLDCNNNSNSNSVATVVPSSPISIYDTNDTHLADQISFVLPWWRQVLWSVLFGGMVIVATGGNLIVVWIVVTTKRMRTVTNYFIVNLSIADAMVSSLNVTFNYIYMLDNNWVFGELYCKLSQFIAMVSICASVFTLMAIAIDRYVAIMKPLQPRMSKRSNLAIAAAIWLISTLISCPMLLFFTTEIVYTADGGQRISCFGNWPDGQTNDSTLEFIYNILILLLTYFLPIISMTVTYARVGIELWGSKAIGEYTPRQVENVRSKRRVVKMMIVVVLIFAVCWLPFHTYFILTSCYPDITHLPYIQEAYLAIYWLAMSNSMYNPIIYCWMNSRFRFGFKMFFRWCPFVHVGAETLNRRDHMTSRYSCSGSPDHNRIKRNDTQKSILYACPSSPKSRRISHCGILRNASTLAGRDLIRHSAPITERSKVSYQQQQQQQQQQQLYHHNPQNNHELRGLSMCARTSAPKDGTLSRQKWTTSLSLTVPPATMSMIAQQQQQQQQQQTSCLDESQTVAASTASATEVTATATTTTNRIS